MCILQPSLHLWHTSSSFNLLCVPYLSRFLEMYTNWLNFSLSHFQYIQFFSVVFFPIYFSQIMKMDAWKIQDRMKYWNFSLFHIFNKFVDHVASIFYTNYQLLRRIIEGSTHFIINFHDLFYLKNDLMFIKNHSIVYLN